MTFAPGFLRDGELTVEPLAESPVLGLDQELPAVRVEDGPVAEVDRDAFDLVPESLQGGVEVFLKGDGLRHVLVVLVKKQHLWDTGSFLSVRSVRRSSSMRFWSRSAQCSENSAPARLDFRVYMRMYLAAGQSIYMDMTTVAVG